MLTKDTSGSEQGCYSESSYDSEYESSLILQNSINITTKKSQKEYLIYLIGKITDVDTESEYLKKFKAIILEEEDKSFRFNLETSTISKIFDRYSIPNPYWKITAKGLQAETCELKAQVFPLKHEVLSLKTNDLQIETKFSTL